MQQQEALEGAAGEPADEETPTTGGTQGTCWQEEEVEGHKKEGTQL